MAGRTMGNSRELQPPHYTEPTIIPDIFTSGTAHVGAASDGTVRLTFYVDINLNAAGPEVEHRINDRVILPREAIPALLMMLTEAMAQQPERLTLIGQPQVRRMPKIGH
jgi:hypothetical protein